MKIKCKQCAVTIEHDPTQMVSCHCDPDATSWIAIGKDKRLIKLSGSNIEIIEQ
jgi:hypothetical protein